MEGVETRTEEAVDSVEEWEDWEKRFPADASESRLSGGVDMAGRSK